MYLNINMAKKKKKLSFGAQVARWVSFEISVMALWLMIFTIAFVSQ